MPRLTFDATDIAQTVLGAPQDAVVNAGLFGSIMTNGNAASMAHFSAAFEQMGLNTISWPGGTISERGYFFAGTANPRPLVADGDIPEGAVRAFDLTYPDLMHPDLLAGGGRAGLTDILAYARANGATLSLKIPTQPYFGDAPADAADVAQAYHDMKALLLRLYSPEGDLYGTAPSGLILELGNEQYGNPGQDYGPVAVAYCLAAREVRADYPGADFKLALQVMQTVEGTGDLIAAFEAPADATGLPFALPHDLLNEIDILRHHDLARGINYTGPMETLPGSEIGSLTNCLAAIARAGGDADAVQLFCSAFSASACDLPRSLLSTDSATQGSAFALPGAAALAALIVSLVEEGIDYGAIWGINTDITADTALSVGGSRPVYTPMGVAYRMMAESIQGMRLVNDAGLDDTRADTDVFRYAFVDDSKAVVIVAADDLPADRESVTIDLSGFGPIGSVWIERLTASNGISGDPVVTRQALSFHGSSVTFSLNSDYEFTRLIIARANPGSSPLLLWGAEAGETLRGGTAGDRIDGNGGADLLIGGAGNDTLRGGGGDDRINPGTGLDSLSGGAGFDTLALTARQTPGFVDLESGRMGRQQNGSWIDGFEAVLGSRLDDTLRGNTGANLLVGATGNDVLDGRDGADTLSGGRGADTLTGGAGDDLLTGGFGADSFRFSGNSGDDTITDFRAAVDSLVFGRQTGLLDRSDVLHNAAQDGSDVVIRLGLHDTLRIAGITLRALHDADMLFS